MPDLIKLYIRQCLIGFGLAAAFVALLLAFNVQNLWSLISGSDVGLLAAFMLWFFNGIVFSGVQFGVYVTLNASDDTLDGRGPSNAVADMVPLRVPVEPRRDVLYRRR